MKRLFLTTLVLTVLGILLSSASVLAQNSVMLLSFDKAATSTTEWSGSVHGSVTGDLKTVLLHADTEDAVWLVEFDWIIAAGERSFVARLRGTLDTEKGIAIMRGVITEGYWQGAQVSEQGILVNETTGRFQGTLRITSPQ